MDNNNHKPADDLVREMTLQKVRETMQKLQVELVGQMDERLTEMVGEVMRQMEQTELAPQHRIFNEEHKYKNRTKSAKPGRLPDKQFLARNSLLTDLFEIKHIRTIYNIFIVILIILFLNAAIDDIVAGNLNLGLSLGFIQWSFGEYRTALLVWLCMTASTFAVYVLFHTWATLRPLFTPHSWSMKIWDCMWVTSLIVYQLCFIYYPVSTVVRGSFPPATAFTVLMEQVRMVMKSHAFVRSNIPRAVACKPHKSDEQSSPCPSFSHFLYFFFCPTLVYRDSYPRTKLTRWGQVAWNLLEVLAVVFYMSFIFERFLIPSYRDFGLRPGTHQERVVLIFGTMLPGMLSFLCGFYCLLHSWLNACAEMLCFADKMFYQDWWNANSYGAYYRRWNVVVHDWLYTYIYKDVCETFCPGNRLIPTVMVFAVSAIVHEYIIAFTFGFFYPMLMITFGLFGMGLVFVTSDQAKGGNVFMWLCLTIGTGLMASVYCMEWYARINCHKTQDVLIDFMVPRSWTCIPIQAKSPLS